MDWVAECCLHWHLKPLEAKPASSRAGGSHTGGPNSRESVGGRHAAQVKAAQAQPHLFLREFTEHRLPESSAPPRTGSRPPLYQNSPHCYCTNHSLSDRRSLKGNECDHLEVFGVEKRAAGLSFHTF